MFLGTPITVESAIGMLLGLVVFAAMMTAGLNLIVEKVRGRGFLPESWFESAQEAVFDADACQSCGHRREAGNLSRASARGSSKPRGAAQCLAVVDDETDMGGWSAFRTCHCAEPYHGS